MARQPFWGRIRAASATRPSLARPVRGRTTWFGTWETPVRSALDGGTMTIHRAAPQQERIVRAPGPDDQQRAAITCAEAGNHPSGWHPEPAGRARLLSCRPG